MFSSGGSRPSPQAAIRHGGALGNDHSVIARSPCNRCAVMPGATASRPDPGYQAAGKAFLARRDARSQGVRRGPPRGRLLQQRDVGRSRNVRPNVAITLVELAESARISRTTYQGTRLLRQAPRGQPSVSHGRRPLHQLMRPIVRSAGFPARSMPRRLQPGWFPPRRTPPRSRRRWRSCSPLLTRTNGQRSLI